MAAPGRPGRARALAWTAVALPLHRAVPGLLLARSRGSGGITSGPDLGDPLFNLYVLKWGVHQIRLGLPDVWNANLFYPTRGTLALSDHLLGPAAAARPVPVDRPQRHRRLQLPLPHLVRGQRARRLLGAAPGRALLDGGGAGRLDVRLLARSGCPRSPHLQILIAQWIPLTLWFWDRLLAERTAKNAALFLLFYLLNLTGGCYLAYMIHFPAAGDLRQPRPGARGGSSSRCARCGVLVPVALVAGGGRGPALPALPADLAAPWGCPVGRRRSGSYGATLAELLQPRARELLLRGRGAAASATASWEDPAEAFSGPRTPSSPASCPRLSSSWGAVAAWRRRRREPGGPLGAGARPLGPRLLRAVVRRRVRAAGADRPRPFGDAGAGPLLRFRLPHPGVLRRPRHGPPAAPRSPGRGRGRRSPRRSPLASGRRARSPAVRWEPLAREEELPEVYRWIAGRADVQP